MYKVLANIRGNANHILFTEGWEEKVLVVSF